MEVVETNNPIVLFDGVCNLCNSSVQWIIKHDKKELFRFASLQSEIGISFLKKFNLSEKNLETIVLIEDEKIYIKSTAIIQISGKLGWFWSLSTLFLVLPKAIRDAFYDFIAKNRYTWFGKKESCMIPTEEIKSRYL